ncbi:hypothetical protein BH11PLA1_BH11PLA1_20330 [soil metagenome]
MAWMSVIGNNATAPAPAEAPGAADIDALAFAQALGSRWPGGADPRVRALMPAFDAPFFQAGLAGYSDAAMRIVARRHGAPMCVTEALLDRMLLGGGHGFDKADLDLLLDALPVGREDTPLVGQIIGSDPDEMAAGALKMVEQAARPDRAYRDLAYGDSGLPEYTNTKWKVESGGVADADGAETNAACEDDCTPEALLVPENYDPRLVFAGATDAPRRTAAATRPPTPHPDALAFAAIDVNLACPVKKIDRKSRGGHWLREPDGAIAILRAVRAALPPHILCTAKLRRGYDDTPEMARNFEIIFNACAELGYAWTTVHARTVEQKYVGPSRWTFLRDLVARHPDKVTFGSGDIWNAGDIYRMIAFTGVAGVSVARGCIGNPWIFRQARAMQGGEPPRAPSLAEQRAVLLEHFALSRAVNGEKASGKMMRKFGIKFGHHHPDPDAVKARMIAVNSLADWQSAVDDLYGGSASKTADHNPCAAR